MKIIVTGGAGFIGSNFVQYMVNTYPGDEVINLDLLTYAGNLENLKPVEDKANYRFIKGDIADREFIFSLGGMIPPGGSSSISVKVTMS